MNDETLFLKAANKRGRLLEANLESSTFFPSLEKPSDSKRSKIKAAEFAYWAINEMKWADLPPELLSLAENHSKSSQPSTVNTVAPPSKLAAQQKFILDALRSMGLDPKNLPARQTGKSGPRKEVKQKALANPKLFTENSFKNAWEKLRESDEIIGAK